jgi:signal transduction histidine kinase/ligand-binding sensor domain-containing protein/DNA-binding response OmpR family regulator
MIKRFFHDKFLENLIRTTGVMNKVEKRTIFLLLNLITLISKIEIANLHAQDRPIKFERIGLEQGLSQSTVYCILQDRQGFMWFGTQAGLNKYDGYNFTSYQQDIFDSTSISGNVVWTIYEDHTGTLWAGDYNSACINRFERETERFIRFVHDPKNPNSLSNGGINAIYEDYTGTLWVGTSNGLNKFDREKEQFTRYLYDPQDPKSLHGYSVFSIYEDRAGTLWIGTGRWLNKFDREKEQFVHYEHDPQNPRNRKARKITTIFEDRAGTLWLGTEGAGLKKFDREAGQFTSFLHDPRNPYSLSSDSVQAIYEDRYGTLWIGTWNGLNHFDREQQRVIHFKHAPKNPFSLSDNVVWSIYEDRSGILWVGTFNGGVNKFDRGREQFTKVVHDPNNPHSLSQNSAASFFKDQTGTLWVGTENGLNRFDSKTNRFTLFVHDPQNSNSLCNNSVHVIYEDHLGMLWLGTKNGLDKFDPTSKRFTHYVHNPNNPNSLSSNLITVVYEDRENVLWVGTFGSGLNRFDREQEQFTRFVPDSKNPNSIRSGYVWSICEDSLSRDILWVAASGVNRFDRNTERFTHFVNDPKNENSLSHDYVGPLWVDRSGTLWVGTMGGGLNRFDRSTEQFTHFTTKDGLPDNQVCGILEDAHGRLWLTTNVGISRFDPKTKTFRNYDIADGLASNSFFMPSQHKSADGEMFFGSERGFTMFHPDSIKDNPYIPPLVISSFKRFNTGEAEGVSIVEKGVSVKKALQLSYKDNVLNFEFAALSFRNTFKNQYAYKLEGYSDNWIQLGTERKVNFTNLDPGTYTLRVKGSNNDGVWNEEAPLHGVKITITPPWWQTHWAYAFYVLLFMLSLYGWRRFELNQVKLRNELKMKNFEAQKLHEMDQMKSRFFANISHEFRTPLTLILGPVEQIRAGRFRDNLDEACDMILRNGQRLLRLINQLLDLAKLEAGSMSLHARPENIVGFLKGLVLSFASAAERKRIALSISAEEENLIVYFDRDKLEKIVSNLLSNALKFTPEGGEVGVLISTVETTGPVVSTNGWVEISVKDTGPGIAVDQFDKIFDRFYQVDASHTSTSSVQEHEGAGIGLALTKELVELHHGEIVVESGIGRGTTFIVHLPLGKEHLKPEEVSEAVSSDQFSVASGQEAAFPTIQQSPAAAIQESVTSDETIILVVEDNPDVCTYIRQRLEPTFKMIEAHDGVEGVAKAFEIIPDLIISDVMMPKRDGNELCRILKSDEKTSHIPIIMLTAKADRESKVQGLETGADDYLIKPFDAKELLARVHNLIKLRRQLRERFSREVILQPHEIAITPMDEVFLNKVKAVVEKHLGDEDFEVEALGREVGMSRSQIHRKLKALTDQSASQFIRSLRLQRAVELLKQNAGTVAEIAYQVGFGSQAYFNRCFHEQFGCAPKAYVRKKL